MKRCESIVKTGLDHLLERPDLLKELRGRSIGVMCHPASVSANLEYVVEALLSRGLSIRRLFGPEHGIRGEAQDMESVTGGIDPFTTLPVVSLYGDSYASLSPTRHDLEGIDILLVDLQDVGSRYYTFVASTVMAIDICSKNSVDVWILDRPNPLGGEEVEGNFVAEGYQSFVSHLSIPNRHGMTIGEIAQWYCDRSKPDCQMKVIPMLGWQRHMWFDQTGLFWVAPSPNMPTLDTATIYPGGCLLEGCNLSEGRGTTQPFELLGAPFIDAVALTHRLNAHDLPGVTFRPTMFVPKFQKWANQNCYGVQIHVRDRSVFKPLLTGIAILQAAYCEYPDEFSWRTEVYEFVRERLAIDLLLGEPMLRHAIEDGAPLDDIAVAFDTCSETFRRQRTPYLMYS